MLIDPLPDDAHAARCARVNPDPQALRLQLLLLTRGFPPGPIDGIVGPKTEHAVLKAAALALRQWLRERAALPVLVPRVRTPIGGAELVTVLAEGHRQALGKEISSARLHMARAQLGVEHGYDGRREKGLVHVHTFNLGNVMCGRVYVGPQFEMTALERDKAGNMVPLRSRWRASAEPIEGAQRYWEMLRDRFAKALAVMDGGAPSRSLASSSDRAITRPQKWTTSGC